MNTTLYKRDSAGKIREWRMELDGAGAYRTIAGLQGGNQAVSDWTLATPKNVGRSNETNVIDQAAAEVIAAYTNKLEREYFLSVAEIDTPRHFKPMLAHKYERGLFPCYSQPKLDGIRCLASRHGLKSREGQPILSCPHISVALAPFFHAYPEAILDGEIYNHAFKDDFNAIVSLVKRDKPDPKTAALAQYHVYDYPSEGKLPFGDRSNLLSVDLDRHTATNVIVVVPTRVIDNQIALDSVYGDYLADGYEGQMVRSNAPYEQKRSKTLLKRKEFQDAEFPVVRIEEGLGNWAGVAKKITCRLPDGREFGAGIKGNKTRAAELLTETWEQATIRFFAYTPDGIPRFPVAVAFHNRVRL
jgi:DNA ligase-1